MVSEVSLHRCPATQGPLASMICSPFLPTPQNTHFCFDTVSQVTQIIDLVPLLHSAHPQSERQYLPIGKKLDHVCLVSMHVTWCSVRQPVKLNQGAVLRGPGRNTEVCGEQQELSGCLQSCQKGQEVQVLCTLESGQAGLQH